MMADGTGLTRSGQILESRGGGEQTGVGKEVIIS